MKKEYELSVLSQKRKLDLFCKILSLEFYDFKNIEKNKIEKPTLKYKTINF